MSTSVSSVSSSCSSVRTTSGPSAGHSGKTAAMPRARVREPRERRPSARTESSWRDADTSAVRGSVTGAKMSGLTNGRRRGGTSSAGTAVLGVPAIAAMARSLTIVSARPGRAREEHVISRRPRPWAACSGTRRAIRSSTSGMNPVRIESGSKWGSHCARCAKPARFLGSSAGLECVVTEPRNQATVTRGMPLLLRFGGSRHGRGVPDHNDDEGHKANQLDGKEREAHGDEGVRLHVADVNQRLRNSSHENTCR
jgi:hypothetical protein